MSKRVAAAGSVRRGLFYLEKGDGLGGALFYFFSSLFLGCCCNYTYDVFKLPKSKRQGKTIRCENAQLTKARAGFSLSVTIFFFSGYAWIFWRIT